MLERVTAGEALYRVIHTLTDRRPLDDILAEVLAQTRAMLDAAETYILLKVDRTLVVRASDGVTEGPRGRRQLNLDEGIEGLAARLGEAVVAPSLERDPRHIDPFDRPGPIGSMLAVPMVLRGHLLGVLVSTRRQPGRFAAVELWWLEVFAGLVASLIASDNAYRVQERRAVQAETLLALSAVEDSEPFSRQVLAEIARAFGTDRCGVLLRTADSERYHHQSFSRDAGGQTTETFIGPPSLGALAEVARQGTPFTTAAAAESPDLRDVPFLKGTQTVIAAPITVSGQPRGVIYVAGSGTGWLDGDAAFLELVATRLGLRLERSDLREREREIERQQAQMTARQEFLGIVSHELKTPVAVMKAYAELLMRRAERAGRTSDLDVLHRMSDQSERMLAMIEQLLDLRRIEAGLLTLEISHFDLGEVVRRLAHDVELATVSHQILVDAPRTVIRADRRRIEEVVTNLLDNAIKYSPPGGRIWVRVRPDLVSPANVILTVSDEGPGIPVADTERVFERFYQAPGRLHKGHAGLGIGLYISRELVRRHGGDIQVTSAPGQGATFQVRLPREGPVPLE